MGEACQRYKPSRLQPKHRFKYFPSGNWKNKKDRKILNVQHSDNLDSKLFLKVNFKLYKNIKKIF